MSAFILSTVSACDPTVENVYKENNYVISEKFFMTESYTIPTPPKGKVYCLTLNDDTLAITDVSITTGVPKGSIPTHTRSAAGDVLTLHEIDYADIPGFEEGSYTTIGTSMLLFEDTPNADFDYNDLIVYVSHWVSGKIGTGAGKIRISVKPVALGSTRQIAFGFDGNAGHAHLLTDPVR